MVFIGRMALAGVAFSELPICLVLSWQLQRWLTLSTVLCLCVSGDRLEQRPPLAWGHVA